jgi:hypothetical protein
VRGRWVDSPGRQRGNHEDASIRGFGTPIATVSLVVSLDGRTATFLNGSNGALSALNVRMGLFAPGDAVAG